VAEMRSGGAGKAMVAVLAGAVIACGGFAVHEGRAASKLANENAQVQASLQQTNAQIAALTAKLEHIDAANEKAPAAAGVQAPLTRRRASAKQRVRMVRGADGVWRKKIEGRLDEQDKSLASTRADLDATKTDLSNTRTELQGSIARTHDELVVLEKKGERSYYEFDIDKSKSFQSEGPIGVRLRKANEKHQYADLELMVDDRSLTKKHVNLFEPVVFYAAESDTPIEIVINSVTKNHIRGYVSVPKYRRSELTAMATPADAGQQQPKPRTKLSMPN